MKNGKDYRTQRALRVHSDVLFLSSSSGAHVSVEVQGDTWTWGMSHCIAGVYSHAHLVTTIGLLSKAFKI